MDDERKNNEKREDRKRKADDPLEGPSWKFYDKREQRPAEQKQVNSNEKEEADIPPERFDEMPAERQNDDRPNDNPNALFIYTSSFEKILDCVFNICAVFQQMAEDSLHQLYPEPPLTPPPPRVPGEKKHKKKQKKKHRT